MSFLFFKFNHRVVIFVLLKIYYNNCDLNVSDNFKHFIIIYIKIQVFGNSNGFDIE